MEHAAAPATYTIAMPETPTFASVRMPWVMLGADSIMFQSGVAETTVGIRSVTATFLVATLGPTDRLGPALPAALASIRAKISSQDLRAIIVASANIRTKMAKQGVNNARLGGARAAKVKLHAACVSTFYWCLFHLFILVASWSLLAYTMRQLVYYYLRARI